ncbi:MAG: hypothetical protein RMK52_03495 [Chitinophagales bacterium]|nr:hypothetical protein [Chitinophagales bacterium]MDW8393291.1 hypothetical protein [Chitinophagales bacterium]
MRAAGWRFGWRRPDLAAALGAATAGHLVLAYGLPREQFFALAVVWLSLFALYLFLIKNIAALSITQWLAVAMLFRLFYAASVPALSDDFNRFLWDGHVWHNGINPYALRPVEVAQRGMAVQAPLPELLHAMNSPEYYSVYPPLLQGVFRVAAAGGGDVFGGVLVLRLFLLVAEAGTLLMLPGLLRRLGRQPAEAMWYGLNPLVITELTGNLHMEGIMIFFLVLGMRLLLSGPLPAAAASWAAAASAKLLPLMFLLFLPRRLGRRFIPFAAVTLALFGLMFVPFADRSAWDHLSQSLQLYFRSFEFNGSIYRLLRWIGEHVYGYNPIQVLGPVLGTVAAGSIIFLAIREQRPTLERLPMMMLASLSIYFFLSPVVHPWYLSTLVLLSPLTGLRFPVVWSALAVASYAAYRKVPYEEVSWLLAVEYGVVFAFLLYEAVRVRRSPSAA